MTMIWPCLSSSIYNFFYVTVCYRSHQWKCSIWYWEPGWCCHSRQVCRNRPQQWRSCAHENSPGTVHDQILKFFTLRHFSSSAWYEVKPFHFCFFLLKNVSHEKGLEEWLHYMFNKQDLSFKNSQYFKYTLQVRIINHTSRSYGKGCMCVGLRSYQNKITRPWPMFFIVYLTIFIIPWRSTGYEMTDL